MGYTHYWRIGEKVKAGDPVANERWGRALEQAGKLVRAAHAARRPAIAWECDEPKREPETDDGIRFNGVRAFGHETFWVPGHPFPDEPFGFCKTAQKPYDVVVVAVLATLAFYAPECIDVSSDGMPSEWVAGVKLARKLVGEAGIGLPEGVMDVDRFTDSYRAEATEDGQRAQAALFGRARS